MAAGQLTPAAFKAKADLSKVLLTRLSKLLLENLQMLLLPIMIILGQL